MKSILYILSHQPLLFVLFLLVFVLGDNVTHTLGFSHQMTKFMLLVCCAIASLKTISNGFAVCPAGRNLLLFTVLYWIFKIATDHTPGAVSMGIVLFLPVLLYLTFISHVRKRDIPHFKRLFYGIYLVECGIAIIERFVLRSTFFISTFTELGAAQDPIYQLSAEELLAFRAIGLYGHPLQNALIVFVFLLFILIYECSIRKKLFMVSLGILAIFCFNARAAILISTVSVGLYCLHLFQESSVKSSVRQNIFAGFLIALLIFYASYSFGIIGGRLLSMGVFDDSSTATRIRLLSIFDYYDWKDFVFGINRDELMILIQKIGVFAIENFWFNIGLSYGLVCVIGLVVFYVPLMRSIFKHESLFHGLFLIVPYITLASTNLSLSVDIVSMTAFLMLSYIMPRTR